MEPVCFVSCREERVRGPGQLQQLVGGRWRSGGRALPRGDPDGAAAFASTPTVTGPAEQQQQSFSFGSKMLVMKKPFAVFVSSLSRRTSGW